MCFKTAERTREAELGPEQFAFDADDATEIEESSEPGPPVTVGLDGGYIRGREHGLVGRMLEVIAVRVFLKRSCQGIRGGGTDRYEAETTINEVLNVAGRAAATGASRFSPTAAITYDNYPPTAPQLRAYFGRVHIGIAGGTALADGARIPWHR